MFSSRLSAGEQLAQKLKEQAVSSSLILAIPRGGVVVGRAIADVLHVPLDVLPVKKLSAPHNEELAIGALAPDNVSYVEWRFANNMGADEAYLQEEIAHKDARIKEQEKLYRKGKPPLNMKEKTVVLVDDGMATGATMEAAIRWLRKKKARKIIAAIPVAAVDTVKRVAPEVDTLVVLEQPAQFNAVGEFYQDFPQVEDEEVIRLL